MSHLGHFQRSNCPAWGQKLQQSTWTVSALSLTVNTAPAQAENPCDVIIMQRNGRHLELERKQRLFIPGLRLHINISYLPRHLRMQRDRV